MENINSMLGVQINKTITFNTFHVIYKININNGYPKAFFETDFFYLLSSHDKEYVYIYIQLYLLLISV